MESTRTFSRRELYELVWATPISKLAEQFGLSDRGLAKICERHQIPVPGRGYWARLQSGQPLKKTPLWEPDNPLIQTVYVSATPPQARTGYLDEVLATIKAAHGTQPSAETEPHRRPPVSATFQQSQYKPTPEVAAFVAELRKLTPDRDGYIDLKWVKIPPAAIDRVSRLLNDLAALLRPYDVKLNVTKSRLCFGKEGSDVDFQITAPRKRVIGALNSSSWRLQELEHVGRLAFQIWGSAEGVKKNWQDTDGQEIEASIDQMIDSFLLHHVAEKKRDEERRIEDQRRALLAHRRDLAARRTEREKARLAFFGWIADARREADDLKATIALVPQDKEFPPDYVRMISWAENRLAELVRLTTVSRIQDLIIEKELFPDPDDLHDPNGDPPPKKNHWDD